MTGSTKIGFPQVETSHIRLGLMLNQHFMFLYCYSNPVHRLKRLANSAKPNNQNCFVVDSSPLIILVIFEEELLSVSNSSDVMIICQKNVVISKAGSLCFECFVDDKFRTVNC